MSTDSPFASREGGNATWCRIAGGKVVRTATDSTPGAVKVEKKKEGQGTGEFRWELHDDTVRGRIIGLRIQEQTFGGEVMRQLVVTLSYVGHRVNVTLKEGDRYWRAFMLRLPNVDLLREVSLCPFDFKDKETQKPIIGMNIMQDEVKILPVFTKDNPGDMPPMVTVFYKGKDRADFSAQDEWLNKHILLPVNAKLAELVTTTSGTTNDPAALYDAKAPASIGDDDDGLPF